MSEGNEQRYMSKNKKRQLIFLELLAVLMITAVSCNSKTEDDESEITVTPAIVAVKNFYLQKNDSVMAYLDSVSFTIDLNHGVIFNADSLPLGTDISRLVPSITFANVMSKAELVFFKEGSTESTTINYLTNPEDSVDFTSPVKLNVTAQDGINSFSYTIKVNVHRQIPDSLVWGKLAVSELPSRYVNPLAQKTILHNGTVYCLILENNEEYTLSTTTDLNSGQWNKQSFDPGFYPDVESLVATEESFYLSNVYGDLYSSYDMATWAETGETWTNIYGAYGNVILGVKRDGSTYYHTQYPKEEGFEETELEEGFPLFNASPLGMIETKWADKPMAILACGMTIARNICKNVWAYDGTKWAVINSDSLPYLESPMLARYVAYRATQSVLTQREFDVWLLFGGMDFDGIMNRDVYLSYDNGVHWQKAPVGMQLPETFPDVVGSNVIVDYSMLSSDLSDAWTLQNDVKTKSGYEINGFVISWQCPYMYIFGGYFPFPDNSLNSSIYRGVLQRLQFTPDI